MAIPFYGASNPEVFAIERRAMDRPGRVISALDRRLPPEGVVADVGAGDGFVASALSSTSRVVLPIEPAAGMRRPDLPLWWIGGIAQQLSLRSQSLAAAYATWAYLFTGEGWDPSPGLAELHRAVRVGGPILIVDNLGGDELTALAPHDISASVEQWESLGFAWTPVDTVFEFRDEVEARTLLTFYFGELDVSPSPSASATGSGSSPPRAGAPVLTAPGQTLGPA